MVKTIKEKVWDKYNKEVNDFTIETPIEDKIMTWTIQEVIKEIETFRKSFIKILDNRIEIYERDKQSVVIGLKSRPKKIHPARKQIEGRIRELKSLKPLFNSSLKRDFKTKLLCSEKDWRDIAKIENDATVSRTCSVSEGHSSSINQKQKPNWFSLSEKPKSDEIKEKEWEFKKTREKLIKMVEKFIYPKYPKWRAMDIVDAIFLETCEYKDKQIQGEKKKQFDEFAKDHKIQVEEWDKLIDEARGFNRMDFGSEDYIIFVEKIANMKRSDE